MERLPAQFAAGFGQADSPSLRTGRRQVSSLLKDSAAVFQEPGEEAQPLVGVSMCRLARIRALPEVLEPLHMRVRGHHVLLALDGLLGGRNSRESLTYRVDGRHDRGLLRGELSQLLVNLRVHRDMGLVRLSEAPEDRAGVLKDSSFVLLQLLGRDVADAVYLIDGRLEVRSAGQFDRRARRRSERV